MSSTENRPKIQICSKSFSTACFFLSDYIPWLLVMTNAMLKSGKNIIHKENSAEQMKINSNPHSVSRLYAQLLARLLRLKRFEPNKQFVIVE